MKSIKLKSLHLTNWRGAVDQQITFNKDTTLIAGGNGTGKSTIMNAFLWLLFGKDQLGRKDFNLKRIHNGHELRRTDAVVEGILEVDGADITLRRALIEEWTKPRGKTEEVYKGNRTEYHYDGVSLTQREYNERINNIIPEDIFSLITDPGKFISLKWQEQRELLFSMAGDIDEEGTINSNPAFAQLLDDISHRKTSIADERKRLAAKRKKVKAQLDEIPIRIRQTTALMPDSLDWTALEARRKDIDKRISDLDTLIASESARQEEALAPRHKALRELKQIEQKREELIDKLSALIKEQERAYKSTIDDAKDALAKSQRAYKNKQDEVQDINNAIKRKMMMLDGHAKYREELIEKFNAIAQEQYSCEDVCPSCHQPLPETMRQEARERFDEGKKNRLKELNDLGLRNKQAREGDQRDLEDLQAQLDVMTNELATLEGALKLSEQAIESTNQLYATKTESPEVIQLRTEISLITQEISERDRHIPETNNSVGISVYNLTQERKELIEEDNDIAIKLSSKLRIAELENEIADLEQQGRMLAEELSTAEKDEDLITAYSKARAEAIQQKISGLFTITSFKLFDTTIDGSESETCVPIVDGVPYPTANTASQVNASLDIIAALSKHYGAKAPIFIDGAERINNPLTPDGAQIILLTVTDSKELVIR